MISSIISCRKALPVLFWIVLCSGCAGTGAMAPPSRADLGGRHRIAVFPIENLSGAKAPLKELRRKMLERVGSAGFDILPEEELSRFMASKRIRYIGGIDEETAKELAGEEQVEAVLITSLESFSDSFPPKIALTSRLVRTGDDPVILWMDSAGIAGNDSPGAFGIGLIADARELTDKALFRLVGSLSRGYPVGSGGNSAPTAERKKFPPKIFYRTDLSPDSRFRVVVLPFYNRSGRKYAGEIMTLHFIQELRKLGNFQVVEPGMLRHDLLQFRLIMPEGVSYANADVVFDTMQTNLLITGKVLNYQDEQGEQGTPCVDFSAMAFDKTSRMVVLASDSYNCGDDRVVFFDFGSITTAHSLATQMVRGITAQLIAPLPPPGGAIGEVPTPFLEEKHLQQ